MNPNSHNPHRRNSSSFNRHNNNHSNRSNHNMNHPHNHQKWPNRYPKEYNREYENNFNRRECVVPSSGSPKEPSHMHGYPKNPQLSPNSRNNHTHYNNEASGYQNAQRRSAHPMPQQQLPERRQQQLQQPNLQLPPAPTYHPSLVDRRHISPPLRINVCDNAAARMGGSPPTEGGHQRAMMDFSHGRRRNGIDVRVSPVHFHHHHQQQHSPPFYRHHHQQQQSAAPPPLPPPPAEEYIKSESPSCKRRRLSRSGRHVDTAAQPPSPVAQPPMPPLPRRSPRQHQSAATHPQMHQVPVTIPVTPDAVWSYTASPHLSLCTAPPTAPPHLHNCHLHNVYASAGAPLVPPPQQFAAPPHHHHHHHPQGFAAAFGQAAASAISVPAHHHYGHQRMAPQRADAFDLDLLNEPHHPHHPHRHPHHHHHGHPAAGPYHVPAGGGLPISPGAAAAAAASLFLAAAETRAAAAPAPLDFLHAAAAAGGRPRHHHHHHGRGGAHPRLGYHSPPLIAAPTGFLLHFFTMFSNSPMSPFSQAGSDSTEATENYEALLNLAEQLGEVVPRGLSRPEIEQLVSYKYDERTHQGDQTSCVVCMCDFEARQPIRVLPCAHEFHARCIDKWLRSNRTCPICRGNASDFFTNNE